MATFQKKYNIPAYIGASNIPNRQATRRWDAAAADAVVDAHERQRTQR